jgi:DNA-binding transcriptional ArsR family regulator
MEEEQVVHALSALAHPVRLRVFRALIVAGPRGMTPGVMQEGLGIPGTTLSFHLKELASAGLVSQERASRNLVYRAEIGQMNGLMGYLTQNCCEGAACGLERASTLCDC